MGCVSESETETETGHLCEVLRKKSVFRATLGVPVEKNLTVQCDLMLIALHREIFIAILAAPSQDTNQSRAQNRLRFWLKKRLLWASAT